VTTIEEREASFRAWIESLAAERRFGEGDRLGTANHIDAGARTRGVRSLTTGEPVSLTRPLVDYEPIAGDGPAFAVDVMYTDGEIGMGTDHVELDCHGLHNTHLDAFNHVGLRRTWYGGFAVDDPEGPTVVDLADHGLVTRGVFADIPAARGTEWVDPEQPVTGDDIDRALAAGGVGFEPGDALLLCMGRDRYEAAGNQCSTIEPGVMVPGVGRSGAEWIADHGVSILCWDFLDASHESEPIGTVHLLIWAIGLVLVDNCNFAAARAALGASGRASGLLVISPLRIPGGTGCTVNPQLLL
jgi:kynurenine formamidase